MAQDLSVVEPLDLPARQRTVPFRNLGRNPYLYNSAQDLSVVEPFDLPARQRSVPFRGLGRNPYLHHRDYDSAPAAPTADTSAPHFIRLPLRGFGRNPYLWHEDWNFVPVVPAEPTHAPFLVRVPLRRLGPNPYIRHASVEGVEQQDDAGGGSLVVPNWDAYRLARAGRFNYWGQGRDVGAAAPAEPDALTPPPRRRPFLAFGRNLYLHHRDYDSAPAAPQAETLAPQWVRLQFRSFGRNSYLQHRDYDSAPAAPAASQDAGSGLLVVPSWDGPRPYALRPQLGWHHPQDLSAPVVDSTYATFFVRVPFKRLGRNPYLRPFAQDTSAPAEPATWAIHFVRIPHKRFGRNPYTRHYAQDTNAPAVTFLAAWAKNANGILGAGKVA